jgi:transposase
MLNQLQAAALSPALPQRLQALNGEQLVRASLRLAPASIEQASMRRVARRIRRLERELAELERQLHDGVKAIGPHLLEECGVGTICAAQLIVSSGDPARMRNEAAFAALAGTSPIEASSGRQRRHRLNRGGDRQLNCALHTIALSRIRHHDQTRAYHQRLLDRGKTKREAQRCVKRALARHFYRQLRASP